ncbi:hypothetical protein AALA44_00565 [Enterococcus ratti]|uniref:hypothetical protein n=1 Tax=Enterococcus ratti TaxID=150033 RepID=UPI003515148A
MNGYKGVLNCPVVEILDSLKTALYTCQVNIFNHTMNVELMKKVSETVIVHLKPKIEGAKEFYQHLLNARKEENEKHNQAFEHAFNYYLK